MRTSASLLPHQRTIALAVGLHEVFFLLVQVHAVVMELQVLADAAYGAEPVAGVHDPRSTVERSAAIERLLQTMAAMGNVKVWKGKWVGV